MAQQTKKPNGLIAKSGIELLTWSTPNGFRVAALLEELKEAYGKEYAFQAIDLRERVQKEPWFTSINPNGTIPVLVDHDKGGHVVFETTAILNYLINTYDPEYKFSFKDPLEADTATQWLIWLHSGLGVHQSQANKFYRFHSERLAYPTQHYIGEVERLYGVLNARLASRDYIAGPGRGSYSAVDISAWPFIDAIGVSGIELEKFPNVYNYWSRLSKRPALQKGCMVPSGKPFPFGYKALREMEDMDPRAYEERERPFREALERAQREFGYVYKSS